MAGRINSVYLNYTVYVEFIFKKQVSLWYGEERLEFTKYKIQDVSWGVYSFLLACSSVTASRYRVDLLSRYRLKFYLFDNYWANEF